MKKLSLTLLVTGLLFACNNTEEKKETPKADTVKKAEDAPRENTTVIYEFKGKEPYINTEYIKNCSEQEKALLAYYCYFFNTSCKDSKHCLLTEALGLGEQNSKAHKDLVLKWFTDEETTTLAKEGGRITPAGSKNMAWYEELKIVKKGTDLINVKYNSAWKTETMEGKGKGSDDYQFEEKRIKVIGREHEDL